MISVIMGAYNAETTILRAIDSILYGNYRDIELIVTDDGSSDGTLGILQKIAEADSRCIVLHNEKKEGLAASLNKCLAIAGGEYIARMAADDCSHPDRLEKELVFLESHPEYAFVFSADNLSE
ncbi:MAG: glycosyltransferase, partial [Clostridia bacterium]|nr:glycosyltransferase [Clostridia bacterium]